MVFHISDLNNSFDLHKISIYDNLDLIKNAIKIKLKVEMCAYILRNMMV